MPIEDLRPTFTRMVGVDADAMEALADLFGAGELSASTPLFRQSARLCRAADRLYRVVELELSVQLAEEERASRRLQAVTR